MNLSEILFERTKDIWNVSASKPFVTEMAKGTLDDSLFRRYMVQDYLYLQEYISILKQLRSTSSNSEITDFLDKIIEETVRESERVHLPNMERLGITGGELDKCNELPVISEYVAFMRKCVNEQGHLGGLTSLLQCSWVYAYISDVSFKEYPEEIAVSKYKSWFDSYSCQSYLDANQMWIDLVDKESTGIDENGVEIMCRIFEGCALYENQLWDALYDTIILC